MKKIMNLFVLVAAAAMALVSCQKNEIENPTPQEVEYTFLLGSENDVDSKATIGENSIVWEDRDRLGTFTMSSTPTENGYSYITAGTPATFSVYAKDGLAKGDMLFFYYPYSNNAGTDEASVTLSIPTSQDGDDDMPMASIPFEVVEASTTNNTTYAGQINLVNLAAIAEFNVFSSNTGYQSEKVQSVTFTSDEALAGNFSFNLTSVNYSDKSTLAIEGYTEKSVVASITPSAVGPSSAAATKVNMVVAPGTYTGTVVVNTDKASYTFNVSKAKKFVRSTVLPLAVDLAKGERAENVVEPEQTFSWVLTDLAQINAGDQVVIVSTKDGNSYAMSNDKGASAAPTAVEVTVSNSLLSETPADNLIWHFGVANNQYTFYKDSGESAWLYCTNANNGVRVGTNKDKVFEIKDDYLYHVAQKRYLGVYNAQDWRCYTSINNNITGQALQFYVKTIGVETPDIPKIPELTITPELVEVPAAGGNAGFDYEVVNPIEGTSISASTTADWIADFDYTTPNKVTFTVTENALEEAREAVIKLDYAGAESKTVTVKQDAKVPEGMLVDVLTRETTGVTSGSTNYSSWSAKTLTSPAVYAGNSAGSNDAIQLRSNNDNSGVVTTASGGYVKKITVEWQSSTLDDRILDVYGKNTAYTAATDLYNSSTQGTKLGSIKKGASTELLISEDYKYIGLRSNDGAMYLSEIAITWSAESSGETPEIPVGPVKLSTPVVKCSDSDITENSLKFTWDAIANASKYEVTFDNGTPTETINTYYEATGLKANTNYSISVKAVGDGVNYTTSDAGTATVTTKDEQGGDAAETSYVKVTATPSDWSGTYLIVYESGATAYVYNGTDSGAKNYVSATISDNQIARSSAVDAVAVQIAKSGSGYSIKVPNGKYISGGSSNGTTFNTSAVANTITLNTNGTVKINNNTTTSFQFNSASDQMRFRYFKSAQKSVYLYKLN